MVCLTSGTNEGGYVLDNKESSKSWFCVLNNPQEIYTGEPLDIAEKCLEDWIKDHPTRTGAVAFCISAEGLQHLHMVLEDTNKARFSSLKNTYPKAHLEPTKGTKEQAEDYINKRGKYQEKGEQVLYVARYGEIKGFQGQRRDFDVIEELLEQGMTPSEIMDHSFSYRRYEKMIRDAYYRKRTKEVPIKRTVKVVWHIGLSGSGKSYTMVDLVQKYGEDKVYLVSEYEHGFDKYCGEPILFMDEFRGQLKYAQLLTMLDGYKVQVPCRYTNAVALWDEVHITSVLPPESVYERMVLENRNMDTQEQLNRRIDLVVYHYKECGKYKTVEQSMIEYTGYEDLKKKAHGQDFEEYKYTLDEQEAIKIFS